MKVLVGESGEYEQRGVVGVYSSPEQAEASIKASCAQYEGTYEFSPIHRDRWGQWVLEGVYSRGATYRADVSYEFTEYEVDGERIA